MIIKNSLILVNGKLVNKDILIENGIISKIEDSIEISDEVFDAKGCFVMPGAVYVHVHLR